MAGPLSLSFVWDTPTGNYPGSPTPAAPWQGQPRQLAPSASYFTPKVKPPAEEQNFLLAQVQSDLTTINTYLQHMLQLGYTSPFGYASTTSGILVPQNCFWMGAVLCGGGGGGEAGNAGEIVGSGTVLYPQGGGGAGAPPVVVLFPTVPGNHLKVTIGGGGAGGTANGGQGASGGTSQIEDTDSGAVFVSAPGGAGCGADAENDSTHLAVYADGSAVLNVPFPSPTTVAEVNANLGYYEQFTVAIAPGAVGIAAGAGERMFPFCLSVSMLGSGGAIPNKNGSLYDVVRWIPPHPQRGGSVVIIGTGQSSGNPTFVQQALPGLACPAQLFASGGGGGAAGANGSASAPSDFAGTGGGGGGGGPFGAAGAGGNGGNGVSLPISGSAGGNAASNSGAGGGGGGGGGQGLVSGGNGGPGGNGGDGYAFLFQISGPPTPP